MKAMKEKWKVQKFWTEIEHLLVDYECELLACYPILKGFQSLKTIKMTVEREFMDMSRSERAKTRVVWREAIQKRGKTYLL